MTKEPRLTVEELQRVQIVLGDALPYELSMLEGAALRMGDALSLDSMASSAMLLLKPFGLMPAV
jgi:hypothetical protein